MVKEPRRQDSDDIDEVSGSDEEQVKGASHANEAPREAPRQPPYERWTRETLYAHARSRRIAGRSSMSKQQLIDALRKG